MIATCIRPLLFPYHKWKRSKIKQTSALLDLPLDIILIVEDFLSDVETAAFRTTCRQLYYHEPRLQSTWAGASRAELLRLIEQDNPKLYYCHSCEVLHRLYKISSILPPNNLWHLCRRRGCHPKRPKRTWCQDDSLCCACDQKEVFVSSKYVLHFDLARLAVDRHLHGDSRGIPLHLLARRIVPSRFGSFYSSVTETWEARIIDGLLFLASSRWTLMADGAEYNPGFDWQHYGICQHLRVGFVMKIGTTEIRSLEQYLLLSGGKFEGSCEYCLTDYRLDKNMNTKMVMLTTFHCLGSCQYPDDWMWRSASQRARYENIEPNVTLDAPRARKSWVSRALVYEPFTIKKKTAIPYAVFG
ncbi:hypothetical protein PRK78_004602 [Emydomyces testavorans]|uniref:F-box domain-containing protein n=1 Tax=Emydomyces testavorans TaxID=2070801 RepID=A0AAF0DIU6_9EURO|nr:hypothetical protein PRK78_004602 [Emydomyces testavorans]